MKTNFYITSDGILRRKENTVYFINKDMKKALPVNMINAIYAYGNITFTSGVVSYFAKNGITMHFFNKYGFYEGSLYPRETLLAGDVTIAQAEHYLNPEKRLFLAKSFVEGGCRNIMKNMGTYKLNLNEVENMMKKLKNCDTTNEIMAIEGNIRGLYYRGLDSIFPEGYKITKRERRPPTNRMNCLISFGNSLLYSAVLTEIYNTQLNPTISYLHEPFERRFSLSLDISEIFKPFIVDRVIFQLVNKRMLSDGDFNAELGGILLSDSGKKKFLKVWDEKLNKTIRHRKLNRNVSYRRLIRLELYKLTKHVMGIKAYKPFVIWW